MSSEQEISLPKPERSAEIRFQPWIRAPQPSNLTPPGEYVRMKTPLQDALAKAAKCPKFKGEKKLWDSWRRHWKDFLRKLNVNEDTESNTVLVETLRMHIDASTCMHWNAREEVGEISEYKQIWEELEVAFGVDPEIDRKEDWKNLRLYFEVRLNGADWCTFLVNVEILAKPLKISEDDMTQRLDKPCQTDCSPHFPEKI